VLATHTVADYWILPQQLSTMFVLYYIGSVYVLRENFVSDPYYFSLSLEAHINL